MFQVCSRSERPSLSYFHHNVLHVIMLYTSVSLWNISKYKYSTWPFKYVYCKFIQHWKWCHIVQCSSCVISWWYSYSYPNVRNLNKSTICRVGFSYFFLTIFKCALALEWSTTWRCYRKKLLRPQLLVQCKQQTSFHFQRPFNEL